MHGSIFMFLLFYLDIDRHATPFEAKSLDPSSSYTCYNWNKSNARSGLVQERAHTMWKLRKMQFGGKTYDAATRWIRSRESHSGSVFLSPDGFARAAISGRVERKQAAYVSREPRPQPNRQKTMISRSPHDNHVSVLCPRRHDAQVKSLANEYL